MKMMTRYTLTGVTIISLLGIAIAEVGTQDPLQTVNHSSQMLNLQKKQKYKCNEIHNEQFKHSFSGSWIMALHHTKQLNPVEAKTVASAAVILYGDSNWKVGKITPIPSKNGQENYQVEITNQDGKVLNTFTMNGINGKIMPIQKPKVEPMLSLEVPKS